MFGNGKIGASSYAAVGLETGVITANPHKLILMLYDGALEAITLARVRMSTGDVVGKGQSIKKASDIVESGLRGALDFKHAAEIAGNFDRLYHYIGQRLLFANLKNDGAALEEAAGLLRMLRDAWADCAHPPRPTSSAASGAPASRAAAHTAYAGV